MCFSSRWLQLHFFYYYMFLKGSIIRTCEIQNLCNLLTRQKNVCFTVLAVAVAWLEVVGATVDARTLKLPFRLPTYSPKHDVVKKCLLKWKTLQICVIPASCGLSDMHTVLSPNSPLNRTRPLNIVPMLHRWSEMHRPWPHRLFHSQKNVCSTSFPYLFVNFVKKKSKYSAHGWGPADDRHVLNSCHILLMWICCRKDSTINHTSKKCWLLLETANKSSFPWRKKCMYRKGRPSGPIWYLAPGGPPILFLHKNEQNCINKWIHATKNKANIFL